MCVNKVFVGDLINGRRSRNRGNYFDCGHCPACSQRKANRRAARIRNHHPQGFVSYFVTLTYSNDYVPYVLKSDLLSAYSDLANSPDFSNGCKSFIAVPVRRDYDFKARFKKAEREAVLEPIDKVFVFKAKNLPFDEFSKLSGLRKTLSTEPYRFTTDPDKISVAYTPDIQNFLKRLRGNFRRTTGENLPLTYYSAPEYGPTSQRFHIHLILWLPFSFKESEVFSMCRQAWPYEDLYNKTFCQVARDPSTYVASYVNCSSNVSRVLTEWFPLRPSHSLGFGFSEEQFQLAHILGNSPEARRFKYTYLRKSADGTYSTASAFYPSYVIYRYFPKFKGFGRCPRSTILVALQNPFKYFELSTVPISYNTRLQPVYNTRILTFDRHYICLTEQERDMFVNRLLVTYYFYYKPLGYSYKEYTHIIVDYLIRRPLEMYKDSQTDDSVLVNVRRFFNLRDVKRGVVRNESIRRYIHSDDEDSLNANLLPEEVDSTMKLTQQFNQNIKQRKIFEFH